jgi:ribosomal-protein-alanine N-acetyltransferase
LIEPVVPAGTLRRMGGQPTLHVDELTLRPWRPEDAPAVVAAYRDPDIQQWHARTVDETEVAVWIEDSHLRWLDERGALWAVEADGELVARAGLRTIELFEGSAEFAYWVTKAGRGRNVAARAVTAVTDWALALGLHRLKIVHSVANVASCRVAEKAGFPLESTERSSTLHPDGWHDMHVHVRIAE